MKKIKLMINILVVFLVFLAVLLYCAAKYISIKFSDQSIDEMIFYLFNGLDGASNDVFISALKTSIIPFSLLLIISLLPVFRTKKRNNIIEIIIRNKKIKLLFSPNTIKLTYGIFMLSSSLVVSFRLLGVTEYLERINNFSTFIEDHYVSGTDVAITFPEEKRNLIVLYLESVENTVLEKEQGGGWSYSVMPELETLALENTNFSNTDKIGGAVPVFGTGWTVAALVSGTSGIPLKIPVNTNSYTSSENFLQGAYTLGDVLEKEGYNLQLMVGSDGNFGGRSNYFTKHGNYKIFDLNTAIEEGKMLEEEKVWWGYEDSNLFKWAQEEITDLARLDEPFSFSFLTVNTHFPNGYLESGAENKFDSQYENVYAHSSKQVGEFISWLQDQDFYENTTLVVTGDHLSMQDSQFFTSRTDEDYTRTIYNAFVNSPLTPSNPKNRIFTSLDMYPTILASIGAEIEGNRLGLGTNLFSTRETLVEELGLKHVDAELAKNSNFYNKSILQDDYFELLEQSKK